MWQNVPNCFAWAHFEFTRKIINRLHCICMYYKLVYVHVYWQALFESSSDSCKICLQSSFEVVKFCWSSFLRQLLYDPGFLSLGESVSQLYQQILVKRIESAARYHFKALHLTTLPLPCVWEVIRFSAGWLKSDFWRSFMIETYSH